MLSPEGTVITTKGRAAAAADTEGHDFPWPKKPVSSLEEAAGELNETPSLIVLCEQSSDSEKVAIAEALTVPAQEDLIAGAADGVEQHLVNEQGTTPTRSANCASSTRVAQPCPWCCSTSPTKAPFTYGHHRPTALPQPSLKTRCANSRPPTRRRPLSATSSAEHILSRLSLSILAHASIASTHTYTHTHTHTYAHTHTHTHAHTHTQPINQHTSRLYSVLSHQQPCTYQFV